MRKPDRVVDRTTIAQKVWDINYEPSSNVIDVCISSLRKKIDKDFSRPLLHTVIGMGYRFGEPDIFNTDQGCQYTSDDFTGVMKAHHIDINMDGKGA